MLIPKGHWIRGCVRNSQRHILREDRRPSTAVCLACWQWGPERPEKGGGPCWLLKLGWMETQRGQMKGDLSWLVHWACRASTSIRDFYFALAALVGPVQNIFPSPYIISIPLSPSPSKLGRQPCWVACLIVGVSDGDKGIEIVCGEEKKLVLGRLERPKHAEQKSLVPAPHAQLS